MIGISYQREVYLKKILDVIYLLILGLYVVRMIFYITMFELRWPIGYFDYLRIGMIIFFIVKIVVYDGRNTKALILDSLYIILFYYIYKGTGYVFLLELGFFVLAAKEIDYHKIMKWYFLIVASVMGITILGALTGCIEDLVFFQNSMFKHSFGIAYTTDFAAQIFFLVITYLAWKEKVPSFFLNASMLFLAFVLYRYSGARNSAGCLVLLVLGSLYVRFSDKVIFSNKPNNKRNEVKLKVCQFIDFCLVIAVPILAMVALLLTLYYIPDNYIMSKVNQFTSGRLVLGKNAIDQYGFSLWGSPFDMVGIGANLVTRSDYNFVDSSFVMICIRYGFVMFFLTLIGFVWLAFKVKRARKRYLLVLLAVMGLQSIMEHHLLEVFYNSLVLLIYAGINNSEQFEYSNTNIRKRVIRLKYIAAFVFGGVLFINSSIILAYGRTAVTLLKLNESGRNIYFIIAVLVGTSLSVLFVVCMWKLCLSIVRGKNTIFHIMYSVGGAVCFILITGGLIVCNGIMERNAVKYEQTIEVSKLILEQLKQLEDYKLYIDDIPYLYMKEKEIDKNIFSGTPYRKDVTNVVIITTATKEKVNLIKTGYLCGQISDKEYIYTNDKEAIKIIGDMGVKLNNFYAAKRSVDLSKMAESNGLTLNYDGSLIIGGGAGSLNYGPWVTLYSGMYVVNYYLELLDTDINDGEIARIEISSYYGDKIIKEVSIYKSDFDKNGCSTISLETYIPDSVGVEFKLFLVGNTQLKLTYLNYLKIGTG